MSTMGLAATPRVAAMFRLQWEEAQQSWVLLYPEGMVRLNGSAGEIMQRLDGLKTVQALVDELERKFQVQDLQADVLDFLAHAASQGWIKA